MCVYLLQPPLAGGRTLVDAAGGGLLAWSPSYWFLGTVSAVEWIAGAGLRWRGGHGWRWPCRLTATALVYALSYFRHAAEDCGGAGYRAAAPAAAYGCLRFGRRIDTAIVQFSIRTLLRSRLHRVILAFYLGVGFAFVILLVKTPAARQELGDSPVSDPWGQVNAPLLAASIAMMGFAILGTRVFSPCRWICGRTGSSE